MRFLHTGDWHLGKNFYGRSLIEDQTYILEQIIGILQRAKDVDNAYNALVIPGDIYDRAVPSSEATVLLDGFLQRVRSDFPETAVLILAGNHDSAKRLSFASAFLKREGIFIASSVREMEIPVEIGGVCFYQIPFLTSLLQDGDDFAAPIHAQNEIYAEACRRILDAHEKNHRGQSAVLCAHATCFKKGDESYSVGTAELVNPAVFAGFDYVALGHIHKMMCVQKKEPAIWYSGSPLAYSFDDSHKKGVLSVEISEKGKVSAQCIELQPLHPVKRISGTFSELDDEDAAEPFASCYIEAECTDSTAIENPMAILEKRYPFILSFKRTAKKQSGDSEAFELRKKIISSGKKDEEIMSDMFELFMKDLYGEHLDTSCYEKEKAVFDATCREIAKEEE